MYIHNLREYKNLSLTDIYQQPNSYYINGNIVGPLTKKALIDLTPATNSGHFKCFYLCICSKIIVIYFKDNIDSKSVCQLYDNHNKFISQTSNTNYFCDNLTILKVLIDKYNPNIRVDVNDLKKNVQSAYNIHYSRNLSKLLDTIKKTTASFLKLNDYMAILFQIPSQTS